jgi:uncharacterized protein (TIGR00730 family)
VAALPDAEPRDGHKVRPYRTPPGHDSPSHPEKAPPRGRCGSGGLTRDRAQCDMAEMSLIKRVCVYCGSNQGHDPRFAASARRFGEILAASRVGLVFGCGSIGLMGTLARAVHDHGGEVIGVIPEFLKSQERLFADADEVVITRDMHERKRLMFERADAFVALPGGVGTLEEVVEQLTWAQLGRHRKPILIANIAGFWDPLLGMFEHMLGLGFLANGRQLSYLVADDVEEILPALAAAAAKVSETEKVGEVERVERL